MCLADNAENLQLRFPLTNPNTHDFDCVSSSIYSTYPLPIVTPQCPMAGNWLVGCRIGHRALSLCVVEDHYTTERATAAEGAHSPANDHLWGHAVSQHRAQIERMRRARITHVLTLCRQTTTTRIASSSSKGPAAVGPHYKFIQSDTLRSVGRAALRMVINSESSHRSRCPIGRGWRRMVKKMREM